MIHCYGIVSSSLPINYLSSSSLLCRSSFPFLLSINLLHHNPALAHCSPALSHCIQQILESVHHCHVNGIVHRDLKVCMTAAVAAAMFSRVYDNRWQHSERPSDSPHSLNLFPSDTFHNLFAIKLKSIIICSS